MNFDLSVLLTNHIALSSGCLFRNLPLGDNPWNSPDRWEDLNALCPLSTLQPLSLRYRVDAYPHILSWLHHWTSLTGLALDIRCPSADILTKLNRSLTCLTKLRFLVVNVECQPGKLDLVGLNKLESLEVNADHLELSCLATLNLKHLKISFSEASSSQPFPHLTSLIALEVSSEANTDITELFAALHHLPELRQLRLVHANIKSDWMWHLAEIMPSRLQELVLKDLPADMYSSPDILDATLFSLPVYLHKFDTDLPIWNAPHFVNWVNSWSGWFRKSPIVDRHQPKDEEFQCLVKGYAKCTHMTNLKLDLIGFNKTPLDPIKYLPTNATQFRDLGLRFRNPDQLMMTTLSTMANHFVHLNKLTLYIKNGYNKKLPDGFFQLRFAELQVFVLQGRKFHSDQWPLLRGFLAGQHQLKSVSATVYARKTTEEAAQLLWSLFPLTLEHISVEIDGPESLDLLYLEALPAFLDESRWSSLTILLDTSTFPSEFTLPLTALWIQNLTVFQKMTDQPPNELNLPDSTKAWLVDNRKRHQTLESLVTPEEPHWCHPVWEELM